MTENFQCSICLDFLENPVTICSNVHNFCKNCLSSYFNLRRNITCPLCREQVDLQKTEDLELKKDHYLNELLKYYQDNAERFDLQEKERKRQKQNKSSSLIGETRKKNQKSVTSPYLIPATDDEFNHIRANVLENFKQKADQSKVYQVIVKKIEKYANPKLPRLFFKRRDEFRRRKIPDKIIPLLHGTTEAASFKIAEEGFKVPTTNLRTDSEPYMFGKGIYFTKQTNKATQYGKNVMLVCDLLLGRVYKRKEFKYKMEYNKLQSLGYDSIHCLPNTQASGGVEVEEFCVYQKVQVLPRFKVTYQLVVNKLDDIEVFKLEKEYKEESDKLKNFINDNPNIIKKFIERLESPNSIEVEETVKMIGDLCKYKGSRFRIWYEVSQTPQIYRALRNVIMKTKNELIVWEAHRAIWGLTYGNKKGQKNMLTYGSATEGIEFVKKIVHNLRHHTNRTIKQRSAVLLCNFSQLKDNREVLEKFNCVRVLQDILKQEVRQTRVDLKIVVNLLGALANLALTFFQKFKNQDKFFVEGLLNNKKLATINDEILRLLCNLMFQGKEDPEWANEQNQYTGL